MEKIKFTDVERMNRLKAETLNALHLMPQVIAAIIGWEIGKWLF